jgi:prepilin-type N-terminal cleavage/methylation domain-containing protein/prepilin-type processing-associated H-X9-DG protein
MSKAYSQLNRSGVTLVEILTTTAVIGILASILLPAIQQVREAARRAQCASQMRQQAMGLSLFHELHRRYPSAHQIGQTWYSRYEREPPPGGVGPQAGYPREGPYWSWMMRIAPFIEMTDFYNGADMRGVHEAWPWWQTLPDGRSLNAFVNPLFVCPSDARGVKLYCDYGSHRAALSSYLGVTGRNQFLEAGGQDGMLYVNSSVRLTDILDGLGHTLLIGERPPSENLVYGWQWAGAGDRPFFGATDVVLGVHERPLTPMTKPDFYRPGTINDPADSHRYHFWSLHPGGGNWALCDGSVRFMVYESGGPQSSDPESATTIEAMSTRKGGERASTEE